MLDNKRILLIIGGGIAAYKSLELIRRLQDRGAQVRGVLTKAGSEFITPLSVASLTGDKCYTDLFSLTDEAEMGHIRLSREADLVLVAPATADLMAKMAHGLANDLASTALLATDKPIMIAPAMNVMMWQHAATQRNLAQLRSDGISVIEPDTGDMACGEVGAGRLADIADIVNAVAQFFQNESNAKPLSGKRALVTAGPTHEPIDPVRYIANRSSGKQGYAIARALAEAGANVHLISGPTQLSAPADVTIHRVETARQMADAVKANLPVDVAVCTAAVADWRTASDASQKIKKGTGQSLSSLELVENPDILAGLHNDKARPPLLIGFAAETENVLEHARQKRIRKGCDWIIANDVSDGTGTMGGDENSVTLISETAEQTWPVADKMTIARQLVQAIALHLNEELNP